MKFIKVHKLNEGFFKNSAQMKNQLRREEEMSDEETITSISSNILIKNIKSTILDVIKKYDIRPLRHIDTLNHLSGSNSYLRKDPIVLYGVDDESIEGLQGSTEINIDSLEGFGIDSSNNNEITINFHFLAESTDESEYITVEANGGSAIFGTAWPGGKTRNTKASANWTIPEEDIRNSFRDRLINGLSEELEKNTKNKSVIQFILNGKIKLGYIGLFKNRENVIFTCLHDFPFTDVLYRSTEHVNQFIGYLNSWSSLFVYENSGYIGFKLPESHISHRTFLNMYYSNKTEQMMGGKTSAFIEDVLEKTVSEEYLSSSDGKEYLDDPRKDIPNAMVNNPKAFEEYIKVIDKMLQLKQWSANTPTHYTPYDLFSKLHIDEAEESYDETLTFKLDRTSNSWKMFSLKNNVICINYFSGRAQGTALHLRFELDKAFSSFRIDDNGRPIIKDSAIGIKHAMLYVPVVQFLKGMTGKYKNFDPKDGTVPVYFHFDIARSGVENPIFEGFTERLHKLVLETIYPHIIEKEEK